MALSMHSASVPVFVRNLQNLLTWLDKAQAHADARGFDAVNYLQLRLAPDMLPFVKQIQIASDTAKGCVARLAGVEIPKWDDTEATLEDLRGRIRRTLDFVQGFDEARLAGSDTREVVLALRSGEVRFAGQRFLEHWALPNFYFHVTTAYALLRHAGVELGKSDYLAGARL
ncbi:MAG: DUF1993 domain-containing protein [Rubrivivax sp.]